MTNLLGDGRNTKKGGRREAKVREAGGSDPPVPHPPYLLSALDLNKSVFEFFRIQPKVTQWMVPVVFLKHTDVSIATLKH